MEGDIEICVKIFRYAVRCVKSEQKKLRKQHRDYYTPQEIAKICDSYGYGFARGVYEAFTRQNEENQEYGLVLKVPKEVKDELEKMGPPKRVQKRRPSQRRLESSTQHGAASRMAGSSTHQTSWKKRSRRHNQHGKYEV